MSKKDKKVGYKKPPKKTQWKKGQSGNPKGRPKKSDKNLDEEMGFWKIFKEEMNQPIVINTSEGPKTISVKRAFIKSFIKKGLNEKDYRVMAKTMEIFLKNLENENDESNQNSNIIFQRDPNPDTRTAASEMMKRKNKEE